MDDLSKRIGFIGGGMIAQVGHLPFYLQDERCEVVSVAESRPSLVEALGAKIGCERVVTDHRALLNDPRVEAVIISAPRPATGALTLETLEAGKHVLAEKPMAHSVAQAERLVKAAAARGLTYAVGFMKRYDPGVQRAKALFDEVIRDGRLGRLRFARFYDYSNAYAVPPPPHTRPKESRTERFSVWPSWPDWLPDDYRDTYAWYVNAASHDVNLLLWFFPTGIEVLSAHCPNEGAIVATMRHDTFPVVLEIAKTAVGRWIEGAEFLFDQGRIKLTIPSPMAIDRVGDVVLDDAARGLQAARLDTENGWCFARQATGFIDALTGAAPPLTSGNEGLGDMVLIEQIWKKIVEPINHE